MASSFLNARFGRMFYAIECKFILTLQRYPTALQLGHDEIVLEFLKDSFFMQQKLILLGDIASVVFPTDIPVFFSCIQNKTKPDKP